MLISPLCTARRWLLCEYARIDRRFSICRPPLAPTRIVREPFGRWMVTSDSDGEAPG